MHLQSLLVLYDLYIQMQSPIPVMGSVSFSTVNTYTTRLTVNPFYHKGAMRKLFFKENRSTENIIVTER